MNTVSRYLINRDTDLRTVGTMSIKIFDTHSALYRIERHSQPLGWSL